MTLGPRHIDVAKLLVVHDLGRLSYEWLTASQWLLACQKEEEVWQEGEGEGKEEEDQMGHRFVHQCSESD